jgi:hypothetical protein
MMPRQRRRAAAQADWQGLANKIMSASGGSGHRGSKKVPVAHERDVRMLRSTCAVWQAYSITSSARSRIDCGTVKPSALAVFIFRAV